MQNFDDALGFIKPRDDVVRGLQPAELLVLRLARLLKHAGGEALLQSLEFTDELTGLANRKRWQTQLAQELGNELAQECRAVVLFDLDHFKHINDRFGHQAGDKVLREAAALLLAETAPGDKLARWGGEEVVAGDHRRGAVAAADSVGVIMVGGRDSGVEGFRRGLLSLRGHKQQCRVLARCLRR